MQNNFNVEVHNGDNTVVIGVSGELDLASSPALEHELEQGAAAQAELVIVDLRSLEFMDSTGLSVLVRAHQRATFSAWIASSTNFSSKAGPPMPPRSPGEQT